MTNTMTYKGYAARIDYDDEDGVCAGRLAGIRDRVDFHDASGTGVHDTSGHAQL